MPSIERDLCDRIWENYLSKAVIAEVVARATERLDGISYSVKGHKFSSDAIKGLQRRLQRTIEVWTQEQFKDEE